MTKAEERTAARDFVMARLAACRGAIAAAAEQLDTCLLYFIDPEGDKKGKERAALLETVDAAIGDAAIAIHAAQEVWPDVDPREAEEDDDASEPDGEDDDDEDDDDAEETRR